MSSNDIPIYIPFGTCLQLSDYQHRNPIPGSDMYGDGIHYTQCIPDLIKTPEQLGPPNTQLSNLSNNNLYQGIQNRPIGTTKFQPIQYAPPDLQSERPGELYQDSYIDRASKSLHSLPDATMAVFFSDDNINHLRNVVVQKVKEITMDSGVAGQQGVTIQTPNMDDMFYYMVNIYQNYKINNGSICFVKLKRNENVQQDISILNSTLLQEYVSKLISQINMYIYYYIDASKLPEQLNIPQLTSMKGSRSLEYNVGFQSGNSLGVASFNESGNILNASQMGYR